MKAFKILAAILALSLGLSTAFAEDGGEAAAVAAGLAKLKAKPMTLVLAGDSTMCEWPTNGVQRGWGEFVAGFFDDQVKVVNIAKSGRSTKTFLSEGLWQKVLDAKPDVVLIQFGHNDSHAPEKKESTGAQTDYKTNLCLMVDEARAAHADPILITPMVRRTFDKDGKLKDALQPYADAMKEVALQKFVPLIDLHAMSKELVQSLGETNAAKMANKEGDATHFNAYGAKSMCELVMKELPAKNEMVKAHLR